MVSFSQNSVRLIGYYGGDKTHALSAWQSTTEELADVNDNLINDPLFEALIEAVQANKRNSVKNLLKFLADNKHETPFEKSTLHFQVTGEIASHIHLLKHRIGVSINSQSARYKEFKHDKAYIPLDLDIDWVEAYKEHIEKSFELYHNLVNAQTAFLSKNTSEAKARKRAKEMARYVLPYATQLHFDVMFNFRSFMHFLGLRHTEHAQVEICEIASIMLSEVKRKTAHKFDKSLEAFGYL